MNSNVLPGAGEAAFVFFGVYRVGKVKTETEKKKNKRRNQRLLYKRETDGLAEPRLCEPFEPGGPYPTSGKSAIRGREHPGRNKTRKDLGASGKGRGHRNGEK